MSSELRRRRQVGSVEFSGLTEAGYNGAISRECAAMLPLPAWRSHRQIAAFRRPSQLRASRDTIAAPRATAAGTASTVANLSTSRPIGKWT